ncbi:hypothetical protein M758_7G127600 [Ceratodon purpureus]|nr:hypothetical protein M758_7G127600 [Ceratodon purpureus]
MPDITVALIFKILMICFILNPVCFASSKPFESKHALSRPIRCASSLLSFIKCFLRYGHLASSDRGM